MRGPSFHPALVLTPPWASREGEGSQGGQLQGRVCLCACATGSWLVLVLHLFLVSALSPPQLWHSSYAETQPQSVLCHSLHPHVPALPCSAVLSHSRLPLGALDLPRIVPAAQGWVCVSSAEEERLGGWRESSVPWQGSPTPQSLSCTGRSLTPLGSLQPLYLCALAAPHPLSQCWAHTHSVPPSRCVVAAGGRPAGSVPSVCP